MPFCDARFNRYDNLKKHARTHAHYQEIYACTPADAFHGAHVGNPLVADAGSFDIKPFKAIPIHPAALDLWRAEHRLKATEKPNHVIDSDTEKYFLAHPDEREAALAGAPEWQWHLPMPDPREFQLEPDRRSWTGLFRCNVNPPSQ